MSSWPVGLQQKLNSDNFQATFGNTLIRSDMDVGPAKVRSRFTKGVDQYTASILLDFDEYTTLSQFFKTTLNNGALSFTFDNPLTATTDTFRFVSPPSIKPLGGRVFRVDMTWERLP